MVARLFKSRRQEAVSSLLLGYVTAAYFEQNVVQLLCQYTESWAFAASYFWMERLLLIWKVLNALGSLSQWLVSLLRLCCSHVKSSECHFSTVRVNNIFNTTRFISDFQLHFGALSTISALWIRLSILQHWKFYFVNTTLGVISLLWHDMTVKHQFNFRRHFKTNFQNFKLHLSSSSVISTLSMFYVTFQCWKSFQHFWISFHLFHTFQCHSNTAAQGK